MAANAIYPYAVRKEYLQHQADAGAGLMRSLGHDVFVGLVQDLNGLVKSVSLAQLKARGLSVEQGWAAALANLEGLLKAGAIHMQLFQDGPQRRPFILVGGHWGAASCVLLPKLADLAAKNVKAAELCFSIPHASALLFFSKGDKSYRAAMREMIREKEGDERRLLTFELFTFNSGGAAPMGDE